MKKLGKLFLPHLPVPLRYIEKPGPRITPHSTKKILFLKFVICKVYKKHFYFDIRLFRGSSTFI